MKRFFIEREQEKLYQKQLSKLSNSIHASSTNNDQLSPEVVADKSPLATTSGGGSLLSRGIEALNNSTPSLSISIPVVGRRSRSATLEHLGPQYTKSSQFKMIVVGHETAGNLGFSYRLQSCLVLSNLVLIINCMKGCLCAKRFYILFCSSC